MSSDEPPERRTRRPVLHHRSRKEHIMAKFVYIYHAPTTPADAAPPTPEQMSEVMGEWNAWAGKVGDGLVDFGTPLDGGVRVTADRAVLPSTREVVGYTIMEADPVELDDDVIDMVVNRVIDNAAVAAASIARKPVVSARSQALSHPVSIGGDGSTVFGADAARHTSPEWAAWAN